MVEHECAKILGERSEPAAGRPRKSRQSRRIASETYLLNFKRCDHFFVWILNYHDMTRKSGTYYSRNL